MAYYNTPINWSTNAMTSSGRHNFAFESERGIKKEVHPFSESEEESIGRYATKNRQYNNSTDGAKERPANNGAKPNKNNNEDQQLVSYPEQVLVEVKVVFVRISKIETVNQQFDAEMYIQARWAEKQFSDFSEEQLQEIEFDKCWNPFLTISNLIGSLSSDRASMLLRNEPDRAYPVLTYMWHLEGSFREPLELQHFPFDVEDISVVLTSQRSVLEMDLINDFKNLSHVSSRAFQGNQEWDIYRHVEFTRDFFTLESLSATKHPVLVATAHAKRKLGLYFWNIFLIVILILVLSLAILGIPPHDENRFISTITMFLSAIAFKVVVKATLPDISYLTYLDIYVVFSLIFLTVEATENSIMIHLKHFKSFETIEFYDQIAQVILIALLVIFHLVFAIHIQVTAFSRRRAMTEKELDYELAKIDLNPEKSQGAENSLFKQTQTSDSLLAPEKRASTQKDAEKDKPVESKNPFFRWRS